MANTLSAALLKFAKEIEGVKEDITSSYQVTLYDIGSTLVYYTPIDTGLASSNWNVSSGNWEEQERESLGWIKGAHFLSDISKQVKGLEYEPLALFYNPVEYIGDLNGDYGSPTSRQAPAGMTIPTLAQIDSIWNRNLKEFGVIK